jgi:hypothetical protein
MKRSSKIKELAVILMIAQLSLPVYAADMYRWVDDDDVVHFSDDQPEKTREVKRLRVQDSEPQTEVSAEKPEVPEKTVTISQPKPQKDPRRVFTRTQQKLENFPLVLQKSNWCVLASMEMIFKYYGADMDQDAIFKNLKGRRGTVKEGEGLDPRTASRFLSRAGFNVDYYEGGNLETIKKYIDNNIPVMWSHLAPGKWEGTRHMAVIIGYDNVYKSVVVADPGCACEESISFDEFKDRWARRGRNIMIAVSK